MGDVFEGDFSQYKGFDLLLGGSPCTFWSIAKKNRETTPDGIGGRLFMEYVRALKESSPKYFLYENNYSIHKDIKDFISSKLGVRPIMINSALVSAQSRKRCYWTNIPGVIEPENKRIFLCDILENFSLGDNGAKEGSLPKVVGMKIQDVMWGKQAHQQNRIYSINAKSSLIDTDSRKNIAVPVVINTPHGYNAGGVSKDKAPTLTCSSWEDNHHILDRNSDAGIKGIRCIIKEGKISSECGSSKERVIACLNLPDGEYVIRKITPVEAERLQTLPDNYTLCDDVSKTQRYKCIGNGWTVDVITHILKGLKKEGNGTSSVGGLFDLF